MMLFSCIYRCVHSIPVVPYSTFMVYAFTFVLRVPIQPNIRAQCWTKIGSAGFHTMQTASFSLIIPIPLRFFDLKNISTTQQFFKTSTMKPNTTNSTTPTPFRPNPHSLSLRHAVRSTQSPGHRHHQDRSYNDQRLNESAIRISLIIQEALDLLDEEDFDLWS